MESRLTDALRAAFVLAILVSAGSCENDLNLTFCGTWHHWKGSLNLSVSLSTGCNGISISANSSTLSIEGQITSQCSRSEVIALKQFGIGSEPKSRFCLYWEPLLDQLMLEVRGQNLILCQPTSVQGTCCTDLSHGANTAEVSDGISYGAVKGDILSVKTMSTYIFKGQLTDCKTLCVQASGGSTRVIMSKDTVKRIAEHPCAHSSEVEMKEDFRGLNVTSPDVQRAEPTITVEIPPALKTAAKRTNKVLCTFFKNNSLFQEGPKETRVLDDVVEITVENEVIVNLPEPIRIGFHHDAIPKTHSRKCVSWDTRTAPLQVNWLVDGCETHQQGEKYTECLCNHLTYFSILVQMEPRPVCHLLELTAITSLGCAVSVISCVAVLIFLYRKSKRSKEPSTPIHVGFTVSLLLLNLIFFLTAVIANVGGTNVCIWVGASLHYALLSSFTWMGIEVFHTFWLIYMVFSPSPKPYVWNLAGFALPAVPVTILLAVGGIYGEREVKSCDEAADPYRMCWMTESRDAMLAHYFTNMTFLAVLVPSGFVMLFLVYREIRSRDEWRQRWVAFLSIWGLSCLFGTTWGLTFLEFGPLTVFVQFLFCILHSFQGFFLMLRFYLLNWMRKQASGSARSSSTTGSTRQHMLQSQEKS